MYFVRTPEFEREAFSRLLSIFWSSPIRDAMKRFYLKVCDRALKFWPRVQFDMGIQRGDPLKRLPVRNRMKFLISVLKLADGPSSDELYRICCNFLSKANGLLPSEYFTRNLGSSSFLESPLCYSGSSLDKFSERERSLFVQYSCPFPRPFILFFIYVHT